MRRRQDLSFGGDRLDGARGFLLPPYHVLLYVKAVCLTANHELAGLVDDFRLNVVNTPVHEFDTKPRGQMKEALLLLGRSGPGLRDSTPDTILSGQGYQAQAEPECHRQRISRVIKRQHDFSLLPFIPLQWLIG